MATVIAVTAALGAAWCFALAAVAMAKTFARLRRRNGQMRLAGQTGWEWLP